jgi:uncharacterized protein (DUF1800 family)
MDRNDARFSRRRSLARLLISVTAVSAMLFNVCMPAAQAQLQTRRLTDDQRILHVLNRLGFGARPGDVARVKAMGLDNYVKQQLSPEKINDAAADAKLSGLTTLSLTTAQLYEKYPQPGQLIRQLQRRGELPADLAQSQKGPNEQRVPATGPPTENGRGMMGADSKNDQARGTQPAGAPVAPDSEEYRRALREYYQQNGLQLPRRITGELQASRILRAVYSERQLQEVMVDFWSNHFNVFAGKGADRWLLVSYDRDTIRPHVFGKFAELLQATAQSPAMLFYLDNFQSVSPNAQLGANLRPPARLNNNADEQQPLQQRRRGINENYARELMELHTLGVDGGYTQKDVQEVARCFTGWTIFAPRGGAAATQAMDGRRAELLRENAGKFFFNPRAHDDGEKVVLGHKVPAGGGFKDGLMVLDILAHSPATAKFIAAKLVRHFVSDEPPPGLVERIAAAFTKSDGDIRETLQAIFSSPEFNAPAAFRAKVKRPFELAISAIRTLGGETNGGPQLHEWLARMGEPLYGFQTPNGYPDTAESWVNTGGLLERLNFGLMLAGNRIPGTRVDLKQFLGNDAGPAAQDKEQVLDRFIGVIVAGELAPKTKQALLGQLAAQTTLVVPAKTQATASTTRDQQNELPGAEVRDERSPRLAAQMNQPRARVDANITDPVTKMVGLLLGSPEFQRQ